MMAYNLIKMQVFVIAVICSIHCSLRTASASCGHIGNHMYNERADNPIRDRGKLFYLDVSNPANCSGNITSWRVCYYTAQQASCSKPDGDEESDGRRRRAIEDRLRRSVRTRRMGKGNTPRPRCREYKATYAVYRRISNSSEGEMYMKVSELFTANVSSKLLHDTIMNVMTL